MKQPIVILIGTLLACGMLADAASSHLLWLAVAVSILVMTALAVLLGHHGFYGLCTYLGVRLVRFGQARGQQLATKRANQQRARVNELRALAIEEVEK